MPKATVSHDTHRHDLITLPGAYVELRQLSYYEMMHRRDIAAKMYMEQKAPSTNRAQRRGTQPAEDLIRSQLEIMNVAIMEFEFGNCVVGHNLEDDNGTLLDFKNPMTFRMLDPKVGQEIGRYIDDLNQEDEEDLNPSMNAATSSSQDGPTELSEITPRE